MGVTFNPVLPTPLDSATNGVWGDDIVSALNDLNGCDVFKIKTADGTGATSNTVVADDNQLVSMSLGIGTWLINCTFFYTGAAAGDLKVAWAFSGTTTTAVRGTLGQSSGSTSSLTSATAGPRSAGAGDTAGTITAGTIYGSDGTNIGVALESGVLVVSVAGTFKIQMAQGTSSLTATLLKTGSYVWARKVSST